MADARSLDEQVPFQRQPGITTAPLVLIDLCTLDGADEAHSRGA